MNPSIVRALFRDALAQVLDNKIFRLLVILTFVLVLPSFLVGAREDGLVVLFGWREYEYARVLATFGELPSEMGALRDRFLYVISSLVVETLCGQFGILFCVAATAFFVPRMLEKGAADLVFSKPVSRWILLLSRYVAGVLFVAVLSALLVGGIYLGLLLVSNYNDPGLLWSIFTITYLFAALHGVSVLIGVLTRSSVAAILATLMLFVFTGCVHFAWRGKEFAKTSAFAKRLAALEDIDADHIELPQSRSLNFLKRWSLVGLDTLHYALPKTSDADLISRKLRKSISNVQRVYADDLTGLSIARDPPGFLPLEPGADISGEGLVWQSEQGTRGGDARIAIRRISRSFERDVAGDGKESGKKRVLLRTTSSMVKDYQDELASGGAATSIERDVNATDFGHQPATTLQWTDTSSAGLGYRRTMFAPRGEWMVLLEISGPGKWIDDDSGMEPVEAFLDGVEFELGEDFLDPSSWYERRFDWDAPLRFNVFFSIGSTLAFIALALGAAWFKLQRIDF